MTKALLFPTGGAYAEALQNTNLSLLDPELRGGSPRVNAFGMPRPISGNFASVFLITTAGGRRYAVKCFTRHVPDQEERYKAISDALAKVNGSWKVGFEFVHDGVLVQGQRYPILKMEWVEAKGLIPYIEENLWDSPRLMVLADRFAEIVRDLGEAGIAHGDLQHGNLLVTSDGRLKLIDYDGMFVSGIRSLGASEQGHRNYQSPARGNDFGPELDRFSAWVIYTSLVAIAVDPGLWSLLRQDGDEKLLFGQDDYTDLRASPALSILSSSTDAMIRAAAEQLRSLFTLGLDDLPPLEAGKLPRPAISPIQVAPAAGTPISPAGLPSWMSGGGGATPVASPVSAGGSPAGGVVASAPQMSWVAAHLPQPTPHMFASGDLWTPRLALIVFIAAILVTGLAGAEGAMAGSMMAGAVAIFLVLAEIALYRFRPEWAAKKMAAEELKERESQLQTAHDATNALLQEMARVNEDEKAKLDGISRRRSDVRSSEHQELAAVDSDLGKQVASIKEKLSKSQTEEKAELDSALLKLQESHLASRLAMAQLANARLSGIGGNLLWNLSHAGITTAADFTGIAIRSGYGQYRNERAYLRLRGGREIHVDGIGPVKARTLDGWRRQQEGKARATMPTSLPGPQATSIRQRYEVERRQLVGQEKKARVDADGRRSAIKAKWAATQRNLDDELVATRQQSGSRRAGLDRRLQAARKAEADAEWRREAARRQFAAYSDIRFGKFLQFAVVGH